MFSTQPSAFELSQWCRMLRISHAGGLTLTDAMRQLANRGPERLRPASTTLAGLLARGESLEDALKQNEADWPKLLLRMAAVGERSGSMPDTFRELERYYDLEARLARNFRQQIAWPVFQLIAAVFVVAGLIWILGVLAPHGSRSLDPLGLGLTGTTGAWIVIGTAAGVAFAGWCAYRFVRRRLIGLAPIERILMRSPYIGPALESLWLSRFSLAARLTFGAGLPVKVAVKNSLEATGSAAFAEAAPAIVAVVKRGDELAEALSQSRLFPDEFLAVVANAEETGQLPEVMQHQAEHYFEETTRRLSALTFAAGWGVYLGVAVLIIMAIFRIYTTAILSAYSSIP